MNAAYSGEIQHLQMVVRMGFEEEYFSSNTYFGYI